MTLNGLQTQYDVVIVGGGHNGLTAAAYLAQAGKSVLVLEKGVTPGGAAASLKPFDGIDVNLSRYAYLVSLFPSQIMTDLGLSFHGAKRAVGSFSPVVRGGRQTGLVLHNADDAVTEASFRAVTGGDTEYRAYKRMEDRLEVLARYIWPTMLAPLQSRDEIAGCFTGVERKTWADFIERPLGEVIERDLSDDLVRGTVFTDATIGILTHPHAADLRQNRTFLYHVIGGGTGDWLVPVGGMGALSATLADSARKHGARIETGATVTTIDLALSGTMVEWQQDGARHTVDAGVVLANIAPAVLNRLLVGGMPGFEETVEGAAFKVNFVLERLPRTASGVPADHAFSGTFHINESYSQLTAAYEAASAGRVTDPVPGEIYCHTLTDDSILGPEAKQRGLHSLTLFGLMQPARLFDENPEAVKAQVVTKYIEGINQYLDEPLEACLAHDSNGQPCIEAKSALDLEADLGMPRGHIFHTDLDWPWADHEEDVGGWGVETGVPGVLLCGSGARRGGCVSGIGGHNAAMAVLGR